LSAQPSPVCNPAAAFSPGRDLTRRFAGVSSARFGQETDRLIAIGKDAVLRALRAVPAPDGAASLAESRALSEIVIDEGRVSFAIATTPERAAALETLRRAAEQAVATVPGVTGVLATLTAEAPPAPARAAPSPPRGPAPGAVRPARQIGPLSVGRLVAVASGKGGVGKSTTAANLAVALARRGLAVGLLDADIYGPSVPTLFGLKQRPETEGRVMKPLKAHGVSLMSIGLLVDADAAMIWRGPMVISALTQLLRDVAWGPLDILIVDMPPGTGDAQLTMAQQVRLAGAVIVSTPQDLALADARRGIAMFRKVEVPVLGVVENMSYFCCPNCGHRAELFGHGGARTEAARQGVPFLGEIPLDATIRASSDDGTPIVAAAPDGPQALAYAAVAEAVWAGLEGTAAGRPPPRIVLE
jgi:ATP-binding protein involved in chromosome partitioning